MDVLRVDIIGVNDIPGMEMFADGTANQSGTT
jgi:hypothetical protein